MRTQTMMKSLIKRRYSTKQVLVLIEKVLWEEQHTITRMICLMLQYRFTLSLTSYPRSNLVCAFKWPLKIFLSAATKIIWGRLSPWEPFFMRT
jgi:hypothetical protein